jgi:cytosine/adenosine deaminase-related metal-dependent hydrolase
MALGSDSRLTGSLDLIEELKVASQVSGLPARRVLDMVFGDSARLLRLPYAGRIVRDAPADLLAVASGNRDPYEVLLTAHRANLRLVMLGGRVRIADIDLKELFSLTRVPADPARLDSVPKLIARDLADTLYGTRLIEPGLEIL